MYSQKLQCKRDGHVFKSPRPRPTVSTICRCGVVAKLQFEHHVSYDIGTSFIVRSDTNTILTVSPGNMNALNTE